MKNRTKFIVLISSVLLVLTIGFLLVTNRFNADVIMGPFYNIGILGSGSTITSGTQTATNPVDVNGIIDSHITAGSLFSSAPPEQGVQDFDQILAFNVPQSIATMSIREAMETDCVVLFTDKYKPGDVTSNTTMSSPILLDVSDNETCSIEISDFVSHPESKPQPWTSFTLSGRHYYEDEVDVTLPTAYKSTSGSNTGSEVQKSGRSISIGFTASISSMDSKWQSTGTHLTNISGEFSTSVVLDMSGSEDLLKGAMNTRNLDPGYANFWRVTSSGRASLDMAGTFKLDNFVQPEGPDDYRWEQLLDVRDAIKFTKLDFCPSECQISIREELDIKAKRNDIAVSGTIYSKADHQEVYTGTGGSDPEAKKIFWKTLKLDQSDKRNWDQNMRYTNGSLSHYIGSIDSVGTIFPLLKNKDRITSNVSKNIKITYPTIMMMMNSLTRTYNASTNKKEVNWDGTLTRSGTSIVSDCYRAGTSASSCGTQTGVFDSLSPLIKITSPQSQAGQRAEDPFSSMSLAPYLTSMYGPGGLYVPGLFTASYNLKNNIATIATRPAKSLPTKLYLFKSYAEGDVALTPKATKPVYDWAEALKTKIDSVVIVDTSSPSKLKTAFSNLENGSWVVNIGHGLPDGLMAGEEDFVSYKEIKRILGAKGVKIDVFAGETCYSGRSNIANTTIGSVGVGMSDLSTTLGTVIGIGSHSWNYSVSDLVAALNEIVEKSE